VSISLTDASADLSPASSADSFAATAARSSALEQQITTYPSRFRVLTGDRPTGPLHLGHYFGTLANRVRLQRAGVEVFLVIADYQVITDRDSVGNLSANVLELLADYLAAGIDPATATIFTHSAVPALNQLLLPFLSLVTDAELRRNPTVKAEADATSGRALSGLLLTYPVHQAADILFCQANLVPVGRDQLPHIEVTRTIARRFNDRYAAGAGVFPEPDALLTSATVLLGTDGTKMAKSRGNAIELRASEDETARLIRRAKTIPSGRSPTSLSAVPRSPISCSPQRCAWTLTPSTSLTPSATPVPARSRRWSPRPSMNTYGPYANAAPSSPPTLAT